MCLLSFNFPGYFSSLIFLIILNSFFFLNYIPNRSLSPRNFTKIQLLWSRWWNRVTNPWLRSLNFIHGWCGFASSDQGCGFTYLLMGFSELVLVVVVLLNQHGLSWTLNSRSWFLSGKDIQSGFAILKSSSKSGFDHGKLLVAGVVVIFWFLNT